MRPRRVTVVTLELVLILPATLFMAALFVRNLQPLQYEPAHAAQQIVDWYAARTRLGLWGFLIGLPLVVLVTGCITLLRTWAAEAEVRQAARQTFATVTRHPATPASRATPICFRSWVRSRVCASCACFSPPTRAA